VLLNGYVFVGMVCSKLGLLRELTNSALIQFGMVLVQGEAMTTGFHLAFCSFLCSYIKPTILPHPPSLLLLPVILQVVGRLGIKE